MPPKPVVLCILDGWGQSDTKEGNAPALALHLHSTELCVNFQIQRLSRTDRMWVFQLGKWEIRKLAT